MVCGLTGYIDKYSKYISQRPLSEEMREKVLLWSKDVESYRENIDDKLLSDCKAENLAFFWVQGYRYGENNLSPHLECDMGYVDLNINSYRGVYEERKEGSKSGSWLDDYFVPFYDREKKKLPSEVIGELVWHVTDTAALNGASYTEQALENFIRELESIGEKEDKIIKTLFIISLVQALPDKKHLFEKTIIINNKLVRRIKKTRSSWRSVLAWEIINNSVLRGDIKKARRTAMNVLEKATIKKQRVYFIPTIFYSHSRSPRRAPVRSAAKAGDDGGGDGDSDSPGDPPGPKQVLPSHNSPTLTTPQWNNSTLSRTSHPCRWSLDWRWAA